MGEHDVDPPAGKTINDGSGMTKYLWVGSSGVAKSE